jgi:hypothetical protein
VLVAVPDSARPLTQPAREGVVYLNDRPLLLRMEMRGTAARDQAGALVQAEVSRAYQNGLLLAAGCYPIGWYRDTFRARFARQLARIMSSHAPSAGGPCTMT